VNGVAKGKQRSVKLPEGWWLHLVEVCQAKWQHAGAPLDNIPRFTKISPRSFATARSSNEMTEQLFTRLTSAVGYESHEDLLRVLGASVRASRLPTPVPKTLSLTTQRANPQWADYRDYVVEPARPWALRCRIATESQYFRFGFKLLGEDGRVFGDSTIQSYDANLIVHIGRNNWNRPALRITAQDIFLTAYMSGSLIKDDDRFLFSSEPNLVVPIELTVDRSYRASLSVNGEAVFQQVVPPAVCRRVVVAAWGDREEFRVDVTGLTITPI
jgi:hypothetical protein